jgi:hypothetical protein
MTSNVVDHDPMNTVDIKGDARRIFDVLQGGGIAIIPNDAGYALMGGSG